MTKFPPLGWTAKVTADPLMIPSRFSCRMERSLSRLPLEEKLYFVFWTAHRSVAGDGVCRGGGDAALPCGNDGEIGASDGVVALIDGEVGGVGGEIGLCLERTSREAKQKSQNEKVCFMNRSCWYRHDSAEKTLASKRSAEPQVSLRRPAANQSRASWGHYMYDDSYLVASAKRLLTSSQLTTFHHAARYSGRRLLYLR